MPGAILENLSGRKLGILVSILIIAQVVCFLVGGLVAPTPAHADLMLATPCLDKNMEKDKWFYPRGDGKCEYFSITDQMASTAQLNAGQIVFTVQMPHPKEGYILDYSRWQQNLIGILQVDFAYYKGFEMPSRVEMTMDAKLGYRNRGDADSDWKLYASSVEMRTIDCDLRVKKNGYHYNCSITSLFELGSLHHDYYLLNLRFPVDTEKITNTELGHIDQVNLIAIHQNGGFTKVWVSLKTIFFPIIIAIMIWFWRRVHMLQREPALLEKMLLFVGSTLTLLNAPLEYFTLFYDMPYMLLLGDIKQGVFYAALLSFWLVFAGEHLMISEAAPSTLRTYWRHLSAVALGCISLFVFEMCERGIQLRNPFFSIWMTDLGTNLALTFIILAGISAGLYFIFLSYMIWRVFCNISAKRSVLPSMSSVRRLHYEGVIYRFKFLMLATLLCAAMTVIGFILGQVSNGEWKWDSSLHLEYTSAFFTGVYSMWNIYIFALIVLYAPSHKQWPSDYDSNSVTNEGIEFSRLPTEPSEMSSLASFARKSTFD